MEGEKRRKGNLELEYQVRTLNDTLVRFENTTIKDIRVQLENLTKSLDDKYAPRKEFELVRNIVFSAVGLICMSVFGAVVGLVVTKGSI